MTGVEHQSNFSVDLLELTVYPIQEMKPSFRIKHDKVYSHSNEEAASAYPTGNCILSEWNH